jgi:hypothetical protein
MPAPCISTQLATAINSGCVSQLVGFENELLLIPVSLITKSSITYESGELVVTALTLTSGNAIPVTMPGDMPFSESAINGTMGANIALFESMLKFKILENSPASAKQITQLTNGEYVAAMKLKGFTAAKKNKYMLVGLNRGLRFRIGNLLNTTQDEFGWDVELAEMEGIIPVHFFWPATGGESAADAWYNGLKA